MNNIQVYLDWIIDYRDKFSMLANDPVRDGGDCAHNFPIYYVSLSTLGSLTEFGTPPLKEFKRDLANVGHLNSDLQLLPGEYVRHPDTSKWYSKLKHMSRDQTKSLLAGMVYYGMEKEIRDMYLRLKRRNFLLWNTEESEPAGKVKFPDIVGPTMLRFFISTLPELRFWRFLLPVLDLDVLYGSLRGWRKWDAAVKQFTELRAIEKQGSFNFVSKLAMLLFKKNKEVPSLIEESYTVHGLLIPPLGYIVRKAFEKWAA